MIFSKRVKQQKSKMLIGVNLVVQTQLDQQSELWGERQDRGVGLDRGVPHGGITVAARPHVVLTEN